MGNKPKRVVLGEGYLCDGGYYVSLQENIKGIGGRINLDTKCLRMDKKICLIAEILKDKK